MAENSKDDVSETEADQPEKSEAWQDVVELIEEFLDFENQTIDLF